MLCDLLITNIDSMYDCGQNWKYASRYDAKKLHAAQGCFHLVEDWQRKSTSTVRARVCDVCQRVNDKFTTALRGSLSMMFKQARHWMSWKREIVGDGVNTCICRSIKARALHV